MQIKIYIELDVDATLATFGTRKLLSLHWRREVRERGVEEIKN